MAKTKTDDERRFYLQLASKENYSARELERQLDSCYYERLAPSDGKAPSGFDSAELANRNNLIRDSYMLEFLNLQNPYKEYDMKRAILENMKNFILEFGRDFVFMGEEYPVQVGKHDFYIDLLFYHRGLQCLVAFELKIDEFKAEYIRKMGLYLEALNRDAKKPNENPSAGIILCKGKDKDVVEYTMSQSLSQTKIAEYHTQLINKSILQKKLDELHDITEDSISSDLK